MYHLVYLKTLKSNMFNEPESYGLTQQRCTWAVHKMEPNTLPLHNGLHLLKSGQRPGSVSRACSLLRSHHSILNSDHGEQRASTIHILLLVVTPFLRTWHRGFTQITTTGSSVNASAWDSDPEVKQEGKGLPLLWVQFSLLKAKWVLTAWPCSRDFSGKSDV